MKTYRVVYDCNGVWESAQVRAFSVYVHESGKAVIFCDHHEDIIVVYPMPAIVTEVI